MSSQSDAATASRDLAGPALRAFFQITRRWNLDTDQERRLLGNPSQATYFRWKRDQAGPLPLVVLERISNLLGIYKTLHILFPNSQQADEWVNRANAASLFGGDTALERMLVGTVADLLAVRKYLDAQRALN